MRINRERAERYREIVDRYGRLTGQTTVEVGEVVRWAIQAGELEPDPKDFVELEMARFSAALHDDTTTDQQGREVRLRYCAKVSREAKDSKDSAEQEQRYLWSHIDEAEDWFLRTALHQRAAAIRGDIAKLQADVDFLNNRRLSLGKRPIQFNLRDLLNDGTTDANNN